MPIKVTCQCGKSFAAKDELAGKAVKCPNCQQPLRIPLAQAAAPLPSRAPSQPASSAAAFGPAAGGAGSLFDEVGLKQAPVGSSMCPGCASPLTPGALICIKCGYNMKLGRRMETVRVGAETGGPDGHGAATADLMNRAAATIEEDKEEERKKSREGMPWWVYLIGLIFSIGFIVMMMVLPQEIALMTGGVLIYGIAIIVNLYAVIRILIVAFSENIGHGIGCLVCGLYMFVYCFMRWDRCGSYFLMMVATNVVANLVGFALQMGLAGGGEEQGYVPSPPLPSVARAHVDWQQPPLLNANGSS